MSPRPGDLEGTSLHIVDEVKARIGVDEVGRNNLLLSMVVAISREAIEDEGKEETTSKL